MRRIFMGTVFVLALAPALGAQDKDKKSDKPTGPAAEYKALMDEVQKIQREASKAYREAKTDEDKQKILDGFQKHAKTFPKRFLDFAQKHAKDPVAADALLMVLNSGREPESGQALNLLLKDHLQSEKLGDACDLLVQSGTQDAEKHLRAILEKSPHKDVQGQAMFGLAQLFKNRTDEPDLKPDVRAKLSQEAEKLFEDVVAKYPHIKRRDGELLGVAAKTELFALRHLALGKVAPDIEGADSDGKKFKLSDYRGKVVVLDFWAEW